jgi:hypothetical protein
VQLEGAMFVASALWLGYLGQPLAAALQRSKLEKYIELLRIDDLITLNVKFRPSETSDIADWVTFSTGLLLR